MTPETILLIVLYFTVPLIILFGSRQEAGTKNLGTLAVLLILLLWLPMCMYMWYKRTRGR